MYVLLGGVVVVVPGVGRQQELHERVGHVDFVERVVICGVHGDAGDGLQQEADHLLKSN